jgi:coenzyme F420-reducing hydrogenase beta subunit
MELVPEHKMIPSRVMASIDESEEQTMSMTMSHPLGEGLLACVGCAACAAACPKDCITMRPDSEGFPNPQIDMTVCNDCGLCRRICAVNRKMSPTALEGRGENLGKPLKVFAAWYLDEAIRRESTSGGVFTALAGNILAQGGAIVGAAFDDHLVVRHTLIEMSADIHRLRGSKYVQSQIAPILYRQILDVLEHDRPVLFSGTPCQIAAVQSFLRKPYEKLFCSDLICMGVPSPELFRKYVEWRSAKTGMRLLSCEFRNKTHGWKSPCIAHRTAGGNLICERTGQNPYSRAFYMGIALRPSCYACSHKGIARFGDVTIGDFQGQGVAKKYPEYDRDDKGTSLVLVNTEKGRAWLDACQPSLFLGPVDLDIAVAGNPLLVHSCPRPPKRDTFYRDLNTFPFASLMRKYRLRPPSFLRRVLSRIKRRFLAACRKVVQTLSFAEGGPIRR